MKITTIKDDPGDHIISISGAENQKGLMMLHYKKFCKAVYIIQYPGQRSWAKLSQAQAMGIIQQLKLPWTL